MENKLIYIEWNVSGLYKALRCEEINIMHWNINLFTQQHQYSVHMLIKVFLYFIHIYIIYMYVYGHCLKKKKLNIRDLLKWKCIAWDLSRNSSSYNNKTNANY